MNKNYTATVRVEMEIEIPIVVDMDEFKNWLYVDEDPSPNKIKEFVESDRNFSTNALVDKIPNISNEYYIVDAYIEGVTDE